MYVLEKILILQHAEMEAKILPCTEWLLDVPRARGKPEARKFKKDFVWFSPHSLHQTGWNCKGHKICTIVPREE